MAFEFIQIPFTEQESVKEELNKLLQGGRIASARNKFFSNGEGSFWAFCIPPEQREQLPRREPQQHQKPGQKHRVPGSPQLRPTVPERTMSMGLNRPPSRSHPVSGCDKMQNRPPGAGSPVDAGSKTLGWLNFSSDIRWPQ